MTTVSSSSGGTYVDQLLGNRARTQANTNIDILNSINAAAKAAGAKAADSSSLTNSNLGLSTNVLNLLQGTQGVDYMRQMLSDGTNSAVTTLLNGQASASIIQAAVAAAQKKKHAIDPNSSAVDSLVTAVNTSLNNTYKASITATSTTPANGISTKGHLY